MHYWDLRRLLRDIARADDRWRLHEAWLAAVAGDWRAVVDHADTGLWHALDAYTDLTVARPTLPPGACPAPDPPFGDSPPHDGGRLGWRLFHLNRTRRDPACYQVYVLDRRAPTVWPAHWIDTYADWVALRDAVPPAP